jgi:hypothetical protein
VRNTFRLRGFTGFLLCLLLFSVALSATVTDYSGLVWRRQGDWHMNGSPTGLRLGESIPQGGLITASGDGAHSLVIFCPDGQRLLFECYSGQTCAQGFRVPAIAAPPSESIWSMFKGVREVLLMRPASADQPFPTPTGRDESATNVEIIAGPEAGKISIASALRVLPAGVYKLVVRADSSQADAVAALPAQSLDWRPDKGTASIPIATIGLYRIAVLDESHVSRMEVELLAVPPAKVASENEGLKTMRSTVIAWNKVQPGWSLHDFLRAYLQSRAVAFLN